MAGGVCGFQAMAGLAGLRRFFVDGVEKSGMSLLLVRTCRKREGDEPTCRAHIVDAITGQGGQTLRAPYRIRFVKKN